MRQSSSQPLTTLLDTTVAGQPWQPYLTLGAGVDAVTGQLRASAVKPFTVASGGSLQPEYQYSFVQSESDVQSLVSASLKASYNLEGVKVSASTSFLEELAVSDLSVTLVAEVSVQQSQYALAPSYELAVKPGGDFRDKYGDYFVAGYRGGSSMYVVYQCRFASAEQRLKFSASLGADVPQVLSADGSSSFEKVAKQHSANVSIRIRAQGVDSPIPDPPASGWTAESVLSVLLPWFNSSLELEPLESYLQAYRMIDPDLPGEVPVSPAVFADLGLLYNRFWVARAYVRTCPEFGRRSVDEKYVRLQKAVEANQATLATDVEKIEQLQAETGQLLGALHEIGNRQAFYTQVVAAARTEPAAGKDHGTGGGQTSWTYGFTGVSTAGIDLRAQSDRVHAAWRWGRNQHVFSFHDSSRVVVGWKIECNWHDGTGGQWRKVSDVVIGRSSGDVRVQSEPTRGYDWTITWYTVDAALYPVGPWTATDVHEPAYVTGGTDPEQADETDDPLAYWTPERMRAAEPVDLLPGTSTAAPATAPETGVAAPVTARVANPDQYPYRTVGRLFFRQGGRDATATAFVVARSGIMTAAHCLHLGGRTSTDLVFVPAYDSGHAPHGVWRVYDATWTTRWAQHQQPAYDVGLCRVAAAPTGLTVGDAVGVVELQCGTTADEWEDVGYPAVPKYGFPFDGSCQWASTGSRVPCTSPSTVGKEGEMTKGGSGGPWFVPGRSVVNGLESADGPADRTNLSPEFAPWVAEFHRHMFG